MSGHSIKGQSPTAYVSGRAFQSYNLQQTARIEETAAFYEWDRAIAMNKGLLRIRQSVLAGCCLAAALAGLVGISLAEEARHIAGKWSFNRDQSDDASEKIQKAEASTAAATGGPGGGGYPTGGTYPGTGGMGIPMGRGGIGAGPMGGGSGRGSRGPMSGVPGGTRGGIASQDLEELAADPKMLNIEQSDKQISITDDTGRTSILYPDGKKHKEQDSGEKAPAIKAHWEGERLMAESKMSHSGHLTQIYETSPDGKQLYVTTRLDSSHLAAPLTIRRVYDSGTGNAQ